MHKLYIILIMLLVSSCSLNSESEKNHEVESSVNREMGTAGSQSPELPSRLNQIMKLKMIGANLAFFENIAGPALYEYDEFNIYEVDNCQVEVWKDGGKVQSLRLSGIGSDCTLDLDEFFNMKLDVTPNRSLVHDITFGSMQKAFPGGRYYADCLGSCGNSYDPAAHYKWEGPRSMQFIEIKISTTSYDEMTKWEDGMMEFEDEEWIMSGKFNCTDVYNQLATSSFSTAKVESIQIGYNLSVPSCDSF